MEAGAGATLTPNPASAGANALGAAAAQANATPTLVGRYELRQQIGIGGMATVYFGRIRGAHGFSRTVAIKRLHPQLAKVPRFVDAFLDEARLAARVRHVNVVPMLDVTSDEGQILLVMEYIAGASLAELLDLSADHVPMRIAIAIVAGTLHGLHAAHTAHAEDGTPLGIVHRDVSPQNILVGADGVARVLDFGVAKAAQRSTSLTAPGEVKGKLAYMAPEQYLHDTSSAKSDIYAAGVVLWETLVGKRLFRAENEGSLIAKVLNAPVPRPSTLVPGIPPNVDDAVMRAISRNPKERFETAEEFAFALAGEGANVHEVAAWVSATAQAKLAQHADALRSLENMGTPASIAPPRHLASLRATELTRGIWMLRKKWPFALLLAMVAGGACALVILLVNRAAPIVIEEAPPAPAVEAPASAQPRITIVELPSKPAVPTTPASAADSHDAPTPSVNAPPRKSVAPARPGKHAPPVHTDTAKCSPPFTVDADGIKHLKRECL